jgi:photosystem II stability/assembly factor-like uncharacterized protein
MRCSPVGELADERVGQHSRTLVAAGTGGTLITSADGGNTWKKQAVPAGVALLLGAWVAPGGRVLVVGEKNAEGFPHQGQAPHAPRGVSGVILEGRPL